MERFREKGPDASWNCLNSQQGNPNIDIDKRIVPGDARILNPIIGEIDIDKRIIVKEIN